MKILNINSEGKITKITNNKGICLEINDLVKSNATGNVIIIEKFVGDGEDDLTLFARGKDGLKREHSLNVEYLHIYRYNNETCGCTSCSNFCTQTGKKITI